MVFAYIFVFALHLFGYVLFIIVNLKTNFNGDSIETLKLFFIIHLVLVMIFKYLNKTVGIFLLFQG